MFKPKFRELRMEKGLTQEELVKDFNSKYHYTLGKSSISMYENGKRIPEVKTLSDFADYFNVPIDYLLGKAPSKYPLSVSESKDLYNVANRKNIVKVPILKEIKTSNICDSSNIIGYDYLNISEIPEGDFFCIKAIDNSILKSRICKGDLIYIRKQGSIEDGKIYVIITKDRNLLIRKIFNIKKLLILLSDDSSPIIYTESNLKKKDIVIIGEVVSAKIKI